MWRCYSLDTSRCRPAGFDLFQVLAITAPIFIIIGFGFFASRWGLVNREQIRGIGTFVVTFAMPALMIKALSERPIAQVLDPGYLTAYAVASLIAFGIGMLVFRFYRKAELQNRAIAAMGMSCSNSAFIGFPIAYMAAGPSAAVALALGMLVENLLIIPLALALAEAGLQKGGSIASVLLGTFKRLGKNPLIISIIVGLTLSVLNIRLPTAPLKVVEMLAQASAPAALFVIGGVLYGTKVRGQLNEIALIASGKLVMHPLLVGLMFLLLGSVEPSMMLAGLVFASAPMMSVYPILGQRFGFEGRCAAALVITTLTSFFTVSILLMLIHP